MTTPLQRPNVEKSPSRLRRLLLIVRTNLLAGLLIAGPIGATIWILNWLYQLIDPPVQALLLWFMQVNVDGVDLQGKNIATHGVHLVHSWPIFPDSLPSWLNPNFIRTYETAAGPRFQVIFGLGLLVTFLLLLAVGFLTRTLLGRVLVDFMDWLITRIPIVNTIYSSLKQLTDTIFGKQSPDEAAKEVVLVQYPDRGTAAIGFVTGVTRGSLQGGALRLLNLGENGVPPAHLTRVIQAVDPVSPAGSAVSTPGIEVAPPKELPVAGSPEEMVLVFVPMSPLPTGGFLIVVPRSKVVKLDITVEQAFQLIVSGGIIQPNGHADMKKSGVTPAVKMAVTP